VSDRPNWLVGALAILLALTLLAPVFGWAAGAVGYAEPLENAAEQTGAVDSAEAVSIALLADYSVAGLGSAAGTFVSAVVGTALTLVVALGIGRLLGTAPNAE